MPRFDLVPIKIYDNAEENRLLIFKDVKNKAFVYRWINKINGKDYLGSTSNGYKRLKYYFDKGSISLVKTPIYSALLKYGYANFIFQIIEFCAPEDAIKIEQKYLDTYKFDYNINLIAHSILGYKHTPDTLEKMKGRSNVKAWYAKQRIIEPLTSNIRPDQSVLVSIKDLETNEIFLFAKRKEAAEALHVSSNTITSNAKKKSTFIAYEKNKETGKLKEKKFLITVFK